MAERIFRATDRNGNACEFELISPTVGIENEGERQYRIAYSKSLVEGVFPREKLREVMREHGMWTEDDEGELKKCVGKIALLQIDLKNAEAEGNTDRCVECATLIGEQRRRMWELFLIQQTVYMNSAEGVAEMVKTEAVMAACTVLKSTNKRYWEDYTSYVRERDLNTKSTVYATVVTLQAELLDEARRGLLSDYPEATYLKTPEEAMLDREIEEEVLKTLHDRADKAIEADKKKTPARKKATKKKVTRKKATRGKKLESKTDQTS
ncbi:MAG: hypothetical protein K5880_14020 [Hydrogenophaga sp.]|uniref:hypothetical protein n=1 Tax=Hydrogenophaga sp. TaxID=1904254 RepID=UPI0026141F72|nr:hypothetical protein [Hydrogenophaga sp.]MCV0439739.1 hypothetical protein [Hydrogenophaga sp.]